MSKVLDLIKSDLFRKTGNKSLKFFVVYFFRNPEFRFLFFLRISAAYHFYNPIGLISRIWFKNLRIKYKIQNQFMTQIGKGICLNHFGGIVINDKTTIGDNCNICQGVTLGNVSRGRLNGSPTIGNRVWIGANSVIVGKITIGDDVLIAPLSFVNFDIPNNAVVSGNPAKIINYNSSAGYSKNISE